MQRLSPEQRARNRRHHQPGRPAARQAGHAEGVSLAPRPAAAMWRPVGGMRALRPRSAALSDTAPHSSSPSMTRSDLVARLAERFAQLTQRDTEFAVKTILDAMSDALARGHRIEIRGFGSFSHQPPAAARRAQSAQRRAGGHPRKAGAALQARQGAARIGRCPRARSMRAEPRRRALTATRRGRREARPRQLLECASMRILVWLFRALIFFTLFAFALNNQQQANVRWFFGVEWHAPMVIVVLVVFAAGCALGVLAMVPELVAAPPRGAAPVARPPRPRRHGLGVPTARFRSSPPSTRRAKAFEPAHGLRPAVAADRPAGGLCAGLDGLALRPAPGAARRPRRAEGLLQGPEPAAQRAARQGHRRLHRGGAARPRHHRAALRPGQPVPPPRRLRTRGARAPAPAGTRRPEGRGTQPRAARAGRRLHEGRPVRPCRGGLQGAGRHGLRR